MSYNALYAVGLVLLCLYTQGVCQPVDGVQLESCPSFAGGLETFQPQLQAYLEDSRRGLNSLGRVDLISNGSLVYSDPSLSHDLQSPLTLYLVTPHTLHTAIAVWSLNTSIAPSGCVTPTQALLTPHTITNVTVELGCSSPGEVVMQLCVTVGTESFNLLNGSYTTYTVHLLRQCQGPTSQSCRIEDPTSAVAVEYCATRSQTRQLASSQVGSWNIFLTSFGGNEQRGYCLVDIGERGVNAAFSTEEISTQLPIPESFPEIDTYMAVSGRASSDAFSYSISIEAENATILAPPYLAPPTPSSGSVIGRLNATAVLPCLSQGVTKVNIRLNTSGFIADILYRRDYELFFHRNCTPDPNSTLVVISGNTDLGLQVGLPVTLILVVMVIFLVTIVTVMIYLTRKQRKSYSMDRQNDLELSFSNAYIQAQFEDPFKFLAKYNIEYNYASIDVVDTLGEGAFGRVFKARAPGVQRVGYTPQEFVAVKTLKKGASDDVLETFRLEVKTCVRFEHPNVIRLLGVCTGVNKCMIFEYMDVGGLDGLLRRSDPNGTEYADNDLHITPLQFLPTVVQVARGLEYLAGLKFVHRDMAARNCLVDHNLTVKIADFGLSRETNALDYYRVGSANACLPVRWMPPEALLYGKFTGKSDVWSFGVLVWEVYSFGRQPFTGLSNYEVIDKVKSGGCLDCPDLCTAPVYDLLKTTWTRAPSKRPEISAVLARLNQLYSGVDRDEGYLNMAFGTVPSADDLEAAKEVKETLEATNRERDNPEIITEQVMETQ